MIQKIVGPIIVNPLVDFKKPFEVIPRRIAKAKKIWPDKFAINYPVLPSRLTIKTPDIINIKPMIVNRSGTWLNLYIPTIEVATMHKPAKDA